jgi:hypothetical protein
MRPNCGLREDNCKPCKVDQGAFLLQKVRPKLKDAQQDQVAAHRDTLGPHDVCLFRLHVCGGYAFCAEGRSCIQTDNSLHTTNLASSCVPPLTPPSCATLRALRTKPGCSFCWRNPNKVHHVTAATSNAHLVEVAIDLYDAFVNKTAKK